MAQACDFDFQLNSIFRSSLVSRVIASLPEDEMRNIEARSLLSGQHSSKKNKKNRNKAKKIALEKMSQLSESPVDAQAMQGQRRDDMLNSDIESQSCHSTKHSLVSTSASPCDLNGAFDQILAKIGTTRVRVQNLNEFDSSRCAYKAYSISNRDNF